MGDRCTVRGRTLIVVSADENVVTYWESYPSGQAFQRTSPHIQWDLDTEAGELRRDEA